MCDQTNSLTSPPNLAQRRKNQHRALASEPVGRNLLPQERGIRFEEVVVDLDEGFAVED